VAYAENDVFSAVWFGARAQDRCLYVARFECRRARRKSLVDGQHASILSRALGPLRTESGANDEPYRLANLVEEFLSGLADALHTWVARSGKSGWATYQPSAVIWFLAIQSFTFGL